MVDLLDRFESEDVSRGQGGAGRGSAQGRGGGQQDKVPVNPFDDIDRGSLVTVRPLLYSVCCILPIHWLVVVAGHLSGKPVMSTWSG